jgi:hypothetical protein
LQPIDEFTSQPCDVDCDVTALAFGSLRTATFPGSDAEVVWRPVAAMPAFCCCGSNSLSS